MSFKVYQDRSLDNLSNRLSFQLPQIDITLVPPSVFTPLPRGKLVIHTDNNLYYSDGLVWNPLATGIGPAADAIWEHVVGVAPSGNYVRIDATNPDYDGTESLLFGQQAFDPSTGSRIMFDQPNSAFRAGITAGNQWDTINRGFGSVAMGQDTIASGTNSTVGGGFASQAVAGNSTVAGGRENGAASGNSTVGGGFSNIASGVGSTIAGGVGNVTTDINSFIGGGLGHVTLGTDATICGGNANITLGDDATICGGETNTADIQGFIGGGIVNTISGVASVITGGEQNTSNGQHTVIGGGINNEVTAQLGTISGGNSNTADDTATVGGGENNNATGFASTVSGGLDNNASGSDSAVGGGSQNAAAGDGSTVAGGISNTAGGTGGSCVGGGNNNTSSGNNSCVPGGNSNSATGDVSFVAGESASDAGENNCFVWGDSNGATLAANTGSIPASANQWYVVSTGGVSFWSGAATGVQLTSGSSAWAAPCDRNLKRNITQVDYSDTLQRVDDLNIYNFVYKSESDDNKINYGPMADEWHSLFPSSKDSSRIDTLDLDGVTLAAVKGLLEKVKELETTVKELKAQIE